MNELTKRQEEILKVIKKYIADNNYPPTVREIGKKLNLSSSATIQYYIELLVKKGYLKKTDSKTRTIELLVENEFIKKEVIHIPLISNDKINKEIPISSSLISKNGFALIIENNIIIDKRINKGDIILIDKKSVKENDIIAIKLNNKITLTKYNNSIEKKQILGKVIGIYKKI